MRKSKLFKNKNNHHFLWWFMLTILVAFLFIPALNIKFSWIDDLYNISIARKLILSLSNFDLQRVLNIFFFEEGGRFRMVYWLYQTLVYIISGLNPVGYFVIHFLVVLVTSIYIFEIIEDITKSKLAGFFASILYLLTPINTENLYRLGPQEPILALFVAASLYYLIKNNLRPALLFLLLTIFVKENGFVVWLPILGVYFIKRIVYKKRDFNFEKYCFWGFISFFLVFLNSTLRRSGYSTNYEFNFGAMIHNFLSYIEIINKDFSPLLVIFIFTALLRIFLSIRNRKIKKDSLSFIQEGIFFILFVLFVVIQSPWKYVLSRYMMPAIVGLVIFMGIEFGWIIKYLSKYYLPFKRIIDLIIIFSFVVFIGVNTIRVCMMGEVYVYNTNLIQQLFSYLAKEVPKDGKVLYNFIEGESTIEPVIATGLHLNILYNRSDITVSYLDLSNISDRQFLVVGTTIVREKYPRDIVEKTIKNYKKEDNIKREARFLVLTTPFNLIKQIVIKVIGLAIYKRPLDPNGIYTYYIAKDYWYEYQGIF